MEFLENMVWYFCLTYIGLAIAKTILVLDKACLAGVVLNRLSGGRHSPFYYSVAVLVMAPIVVFTFLPWHLRQEKFRFFLAYTNRKVMREIIGAYKAT